MQLPELTTRSIDFKRATGMRFGSEAWVLRAFCRAMGDIDLTVVRPDAVLAYIAGDGPVTSFWHHKFKILNGFYRFAIARGYTQTSPLPTTIPQCPPPPQIPPTHLCRQWSLKPTGFFWVKLPLGRPHFSLYDMALYYIV